MTSAPAHAAFPPARPNPSPEQIELILREVEALPTLPAIATRLLTISNLEDADLDQIVEIIEGDPTLTARVLGLCRTADKGLGDRVTTVRRAVVMMGLESVQAALLSVAVFEVMRPGKAARSAAVERSGSELAIPFDRDGFWRYCIAVASAAELIAEGHVDLGVRPEEAFVSGLLHDIGKLGLEVILPKAYGRVLGVAERRQTTSSDAEQQLLGVDHHIVGRRLAEHWGLPEAIQDVIWLNGQPLDAIADPQTRNLLGIVWVARTLCRSLHLGWSGDFDYPESLKGPHGVCRRLGLSPELVESCVGRLHEGVARRCAVLGLDQAASGDLLLSAVQAANSKLGKLSMMFEQRSRTATRQAKVLTAISQFQNALATGRNARGVVETLAALARSASTALGPGLLGVVYQLRENDPWQLLRFGPDGRPSKAQTVDTPAPPAAALPASAAGGRVASLSALCNPAALPVRAIALLPWLTDYLADAQDLRTVQLLPLIASGGDTQGPAVVLIHDQDIARTMEPPLMEPLVASWLNAIGSASDQDASRRLGERLAQANRNLQAAQARIAESQAMVKLGEFAAGAAHEMNNPLTVISGRAQLLAATASSDVDRAASAAIVDGAERLSDLITSLRLIADPPKPRLESTSFDAIVRAAIASGQERAGTSGKGITVRLPSPAPALLLDRPMVASSLAELIANAIQASPDTPITIEAQTDPVDGRSLFVVTDQGPGMSPKALQHAFDPFFSEKQAGRRTGLGLTRARTLVEAHGGEIHLRSAPGEGTVATIALPAHQTAARAQ